MSRGDLDIKKTFLQKQREALFGSQFPETVLEPGEYLLLFDLTATEVYQRTQKEGEKPKTSRTPIFPEHWKNQFGLPVDEHRKSIKINIFDGYTVFTVPDENAPPAPMT